MPGIEDIFGESGGLSKLVPGFVARPVQVDLAQTIAEAIVRKRHALLEAGTGTGKTLAYLVPIFLSGKKSIISTGTKALQDQLYFKDLPLVSELFENQSRIAILKGRANYVCPERLEKSLKIHKGARQSSGDLLDRLVRIREWSTRTILGDLTEHADLDTDPALLSMVTSTRDNCLGGSCPKYDQCPLYRAREKASEADILVVNHHLLFADLALKEDSLTQLLPRVECVIVDEAHQIPKVARVFFGQRFSSGQVSELIRDVRRELSLLGNDESELLSATGRLEKNLSIMSTQLRDDSSREGQGFELSDWFDGRGAPIVESIDMSLGDMMEILDIVAQRSIGLEHCQQRISRLIDQFALLTEPAAEEEPYIHWVQVHDHGFVVNLSPFTVSNALAAHFDGSKSSWILTSATLAIGHDFSHIKQLLGLNDDTIQKQFDSPFAYVDQVVVYTPEYLPLPGSDEHTFALVQSILPFVSDNKILFLFTSHKALKLAAEQLMVEPLTVRQEVAVYWQGQFSKVELLQRFKQTPHCILLATQSFWEGIDLRGAGLTCLVIDKLPFASPDDPLEKALMRYIASGGGNGFMEHSLPQAIISLRQGFGRLIRQESDWGVFVLGDPRVDTKHYGAIVRKSLPAMHWTRDLDKAMNHLNERIKKHEPIGN